MREGRRVTRGRSGCGGGGSAAPSGGALVVVPHMEIGSSLPLFCEGKCISETT